MKVGMNFYGSWRMGNTNTSCDPSLLFRVPVIEINRFAIL
jgi:hypothetical protein